MVFRILEGSREKSEFLVCDGFGYHWDSRYPDGHRVRCTQRNRGCRGIGQIHPDGNIKILHDHGHDPNPTIIEEYEMKRWMENEVLTTDTPIVRKIYDRACEMFREAAIKISWKTARSLMYRVMPIRYRRQVTADPSRMGQQRRRRADQQIEAAGRRATIEAARGHAPPQRRVRNDVRQNSATEMRVNLPLPDQGPLSENHCYIQL